MQRASAGIQGYAVFHAAKRGEFALKGLHFRSKNEGGRQANMVQSFADFVAKQVVLQAQIVVRDGNRRGTGSIGRGSHDISRSRAWSL